MAFHTSRPLNISLLDTRPKPDGTRGDPTGPDGPGRVRTRPAPPAAAATPRPDVRPEVTGAVSGAVNRAIWPVTALPRHPGLDPFGRGENCGGVAQGLYLHCRLDGRPCQALVDTGSTISLVRPGVLPGTTGALSGGWTATSGRLTTVTGQEAGMRGRKQLVVQVGDQEVVHGFWLADIRDPCIIGLDLLIRWGVRVDVAGAAITASQAFNVESSAWKTLTAPESTAGWFGYKVIQRQSGLLVSAPLFQTSTANRGRIYNCNPHSCNPITQPVPVFAVNMSLGLAMTSDPATKKIMACGPTITRECRTINTYNGLCLEINSADTFGLPKPSTLRASATVDFNTMKTFVKDLIRSLAGRDTKFAITQYASDPFTHFYFDTLNSRTWESDISSITQQRGGTYTAKAIAHVANDVFSTSRGSRSDSKKFLIVITDGESNDNSQLSSAVQQAERIGVVRFSIGVGNSFRNPSAKQELADIGSSPPETHVFRVENFNALEVIRKGLAESIFSIEGTQTGGSLKMEMAQEGFSVAFIPNGGFQMASVGANDWSGGFQGYSSTGQLMFSEEQQVVQPDSYQGYSMAIANTRYGPVTITGAPRYQHRGVAFVYPKSSDLSIRQRVDPSPWQSQIGEYFGAEIVTMAVNQQQYSQVVLIAAPLHMEEYSEGRVYVCTLTASEVERVDCRFDAPIILRGQKGEKGRFGTSMAPLPDLNQDGFKDLAVGAPLENQGQGSVYIFHGTASGTINTRISQRVAGSDVQPRLRFFGLSISQASFDLSEDGLPDLAVGSKGTVVLLRSKPIVMVITRVNFSPTQIPSSDECINPERISADICFNMASSSNQNVQANITFSLSLDVTRKRAFFDSKARVQNASFTLSPGDYCVKYDFFIEPCPEDSLHELINELNFSFDGLASQDRPRPSLAEQAQTTTNYPLGFKVNCISACVDELKVKFNFSGSSSVRVGIDDLLNVTASLTNLGEDSYNSQVILTYPTGLSFRKFSTVQGRVECTSLDSLNEVSLGRSSCLIYKPIFKTNAKAVFTVSYGIDSNSQLSRKMRITAKATSDLSHSPQSELSQSKEIDVKYSIFLSIASSLSYTNFSFGSSDVYKPVVNPVKVLNFGRAFNVTVVIKVPVRLGAQHIWQERDDLQCRRDGVQEPGHPDFLMEIQQNLAVDCSVASCLVFRCNMFMGRGQSSTFTITANLSSVWITQIGLQSAKFLLISTATLEYQEDKYIFYSTESKHTPPIQKIVTEVEVYPVANFTKEIVGGTIGGLILLAIITAGLYKAGFFKSQYKQMIEEADASGEGGDGGGGDGEAGGEIGGEAP
ncbi:Integrin alpha-X [Merluccius polli]|uniref:Integrin alpha-X n=1 Tax=Merluccius polli TaxID=89951 RepID=A0AA47PB19_MERPO|nr:Integrin alpha-X [Merluccius polli]